uniref:hypothetical protein n=1 Tax=Streptomyces aurantiacus TaxID=47760 RepID=UPI0012FEB3DF
MTAAGADVPTAERCTAGAGVDADDAAAADAADDIDIGVGVRPWLRAVAPTTVGVTAEVIAVARCTARGVVA